MRVSDSVKKSMRQTISTAFYDPIKKRELKIQRLVFSYEQIGHALKDVFVPRNRLKKTPARMAIATAATILAWIPAFIFVSGAMVLNGIWQGIKNRFERG